MVLSEEEISAVVDRLATEISADYHGRDIVVVGVLRGSVLFVADLIRRLTVPVRLDFVALSSYGDRVSSSGEVRLQKDLEESAEGRHLLLVEDIVDTGLTLSYLLASMQARGAASVKSCALLDKPSRREVDTRVDYVGKVVPDEFLVGYGLDYAQKYRNLPYVGVLRRELYQS